MSQLSPAPVFSYPNQRVVRPPLSRAHRNRAFLAGAVSNTVLTAGLAIVSLAAILFIIVAIMSFVWALIPDTEADRYRPLDEILGAVGLSPDQSWVVWVVLVVTMLLGLAVAWAGIWIGKAIIASAGVARPWAVTWSASGILLGFGLIVSTVISPLAGPALSVMFGALAASGAVTDDGSTDVGLLVAISIIGSLLSLVVYAAAGSLVWWWMAHALRRAA
jgi:hypothetical protein